VLRVMLGFGLLLCGCALRESVCVWSGGGRAGWTGLSSCVGAGAVVLRHVVRAVNFVWLVSAIYWVGVCVWVSEGCGVIPCGSPLLWVGSVVVEPLRFV